MDLSKLLDIIEKQPEFQKLAGLVEQNGAGYVSSIPVTWPLLAAALRKVSGRPALVITARSEDARRFYEQLAPWCPGVTLLHFPEPDALPYERLTPDLGTTQARIKALSCLVPDPVGDCKAGAGPGKGLIIVGSAYAVAQKTISKNAFAGTSFTIAKGGSADVAALLARLDAMGYEAETTVEVPGTFSRRGGIIDVYPYGNTWPVRLELVGQQVESLRHFDPANQRSREQVNEFTIEPALEMSLPPDLDGYLAGWQEKLQLDRCSEETRQRFNEELEMVRGRQKFAGMAYYAPLFNTDTILDYLPANGLLLCEDPARLEEALDELDAMAGEVRQSQLEKCELPPGFPAPYLSWPELGERLKTKVPIIRFQVPSDGDFPFGAKSDSRGRDTAAANEGVGDLHPLLTSPFKGEGGNRFTFAFDPAPGYSAQLQKFIGDVGSMKEEGRRITIVSHQAPRLSNLLEENEIIAAVAADLNELPARGDIKLVRGMLDGGWAFQDGDEEFIIFTDREIFGFVKQRREVKRRAVKRLLYLSELEPGDFVVHADHGVARFAGTTRLTTDGSEREYLILEYSGDDKLYVPVEQIDRITRYVGARNETPNVSRLGTQEWRHTRQKAKEAAEKVAKELLEVYAARELKQGYAFSPDTVWQQELEASFPYTETPDQIEAIREVKEDMEKQRPMDRLVCGDVGYGKTEVALRAAFKCVMDGKQVAVLVPTTILAQQHYRTFTERLKPFPMRIEMLSRFCSRKEQQAAVDALALGKVDICIGTHRLLQKDVAFKNLGLVIIDEEQRFGVFHKEHFKKMRHEVDVLALSATPIPRTLYMALVSVRDMSTMETPPEERLPIKTMVGDYQDRIVREAVLRELERDGQVFFVHNRVQGINALADRLREIVPEAKITVGHGQMPEEKLEQVMLDFSQQKYNVLVCTTIIESGLDMPSVNTLIVNDADRLGLTQLYQLRGRVGRGTNRAYAYFLYKKGKRLTPQAEKRLQAIFEATELGAGFHLAMKDLEIRGAGNLLGAEQSGQISAVGFELYTQLLADAVANLRAARPAGGTAPVLVPKSPLPSVELPVSAYIPVSYVSDIAVRLNLYQKMARVSGDSEIEEIGREMVDRFGKLPPPARNLLYVLKIKRLAGEAGLSGIGRDNGNILLRFQDMARWSKRTLKGGYDGLKISYDGLRLPAKPGSSPGWQEALEKLLRELIQMQ
ncbi:MAG: transcription-repair coupling factor [Chloroflexi bacterium]|nr:transcription-repair coupling factor [Chloroflexota bacterium]